MPRKPRTEVIGQPTQELPQAPAGTPSARTRGEVPLSTPVDQEAMARWVESIYSWMHPALQREAAWLSRNPDDQDSRGRVQYYRHALAVSRQLAYMIRTFRLRDL